MTIDDRIREALKDADSKGKLCIVSAITGVKEGELRQIMGGLEEIPLDTRLILEMHISPEQDDDAF